MSGIFLSYRREDSSRWVGHLASLLRGHFSADQVFMVIHTIEPGMDFVEALTNHLRSCDVLLAVIGPHWLTTKDPCGLQRLKDPTDYVRLEITTALERNIRVIPVLVGGSADAHRRRSARCIWKSWSADRHTSRAIRGRDTTPTSWLSRSKRP